jgi:hypothetical protein
MFLSIQESDFEFVEPLHKSMFYSILSLNI